MNDPTPNKKFTSRFDLRLATKEINQSKNLRQSPRLAFEPYLGIINLAGTEESLQREISRNKKSCEIHKEFSGDIEEYQKEVYSH